MIYYCPECGRKNIELYIHDSIVKNAKFKMKCYVCGHEYIAKLKDAN